MNALLMSVRRVVLADNPAAKIHEAA
jgi:hypothetical protein